MKKLLKSSVCFLLVFITMGQVVEASSDTNIISYETYSETLIQEYKKYDIEIEMQEIEGQIYTQELLNEELQIVSDNATKMKKWADIPVELEGYASREDTPVINPRAMYVTKPVTASAKLTDLTMPTFPLSCTISVTADVYVNAQACSILKGYKPELEVTKATGFDDWIELVSYSTSINNSSTTVIDHYIKYTITAKVKKSVSIGGVTSWEKVSKNFNVKLYPFK